MRTQANINLTDNDLKVIYDLKHNPLLIKNKIIVENIVEKARLELIDILPENAGTFNETEYVLPVHSALLGKTIPSPAHIRKNLTENAGADIKKQLETFLLAAELYESSRKDRAEFFLSDLEVQELVFRGSKWMRGWVLILGNRNNLQLSRKFNDKGFIVFTDTPDIEQTIYIGNRPTSPIYFLQLMVRYGLIWGCVKPGDDHILGHYLEKDMPGIMVITEDLADLKYCIALGLMKLGAPAVVPLTFPFPYGNTVKEDIPKEIIKAGSSFPNLRIKHYKGKTISLPSFCDPVNVNQKFEPLYVYNNAGTSFFQLRPAKHKILIKQTPEDIGENICILVNISHPKLDIPLSLELENSALQSINYMNGYKALRKGNQFIIQTKEKTDIQKIKLAISSGLRFKYPKLKNISIDIIRSPTTINKIKPQIDEFRMLRNKIISSMNQDNTEIFGVCTECRAFSKVHTCILIPNRLPMCGSKTYFSVLAASYFGSTSTPNKRAKDKSIPFRTVFKKGQIINSERGEYSGSNKIYKKLTKGELNKVYLNSIRNYPQTSCGCFQNLAFWIKDVQGIGIMKRGSSALTPDGHTWSSLANLAGGKQSDGICGVSLSYIFSPEFLKGDGGLNNVVWTDSKLFEQLRNRIPKEQKIATEKNVSNIKELKKFIGRS